MTVRSIISRALGGAVLAAGILAGTTLSASAQNNVITYVDFFWQDQTQAACISTGEDAVNQAIDAFGVADPEVQTAAWYALVNTPDYNFWVFCIGDDDGVTDPTGNRILTIVLVASGRPDVINENVRNYLADCMEVGCPTVEAAAETIEWSTNALQYRDRSGPFTLYCPALGNGSFRPVWGTDVYTTDSSICTAAVHAGAITMNGGAVTIEIVDGLSSYTGSERNGVSTANWGSYPTSFRFVSGGKG